MDYDLAIFQFEKIINKYPSLKNLDKSQAIRRNQKEFLRILNTHKLFRNLDVEEQGSP